MIVRQLHKATGGDTMPWRLVDVIVKRRADLDVLAYAVEQGWIEVAPEIHCVRLTDEGRRVVQ